MKSAQLLALALLSVALTACGPSKKPLSAESKASLRTVAIESNIELPTEMWFQGKTQNIADNFGLIGDLIGDSAGDDSVAALEAVMKKRQISVSGIVRSAFRNEMKKYTPYKPLKSGSQADANLVLSIDSYGFTAMGASSKFAPRLVLFAEMQDNDGNVIWRNKGTVTALTKENTAKYTYKQMLENQDVLREMVQTAANMAAKSAMADL